jgi:hypothetical protein
LRLFQRLRLPLFCHCGWAAVAEIVAPWEIDVSAAFASADDATKPSEASDSANASNLFMLFPLCQKKLAEPTPGASVMLTGRVRPTIEDGNRE